jgi:hypothetical protein
MHVDRNAYIRAQTRYASWTNTQAAAGQVSKIINDYIITNENDKLIEAFDALTAALSSSQSEMDNLLAKWRTPRPKNPSTSTPPPPKASAVDIRRMTQLGMEIDGLQRMLDTYFSGDEITEAVQKRARTTYRRGVEALNKQRERVERRASGDLKVGGKLQTEDLIPKEGVVRTGDELRKLLEEHKSPQLFSELNLLDTTQAVPLLTEDEIDFLDQVQNAAKNKILPNGDKVDWGASYNHQSIAEMYMAMELNGYNDQPVQVSMEEALAMMKERDDAGKPRWFMMSRWVSGNKDRPQLTTDDMVTEYRQGTRWPPGAGQSAGGRGDNFAGGAGFSGYGTEGIIALVSADSKIANREFLGDVEKSLRSMIKKLATARHLPMAEDDSVDKSQPLMTEDELMSFADTLKGSIPFDKWRNLPNIKAGSPLANEATAVISTLVEHWLQLELAKMASPSDEEEREWNERLLRMQQGIFGMDDSRLAIFMGYDGYFSNEQPWFNNRVDIGSVEHSDWSARTEKDFSSTQIIWLNRTALTVLDRTASRDDAQKILGA